MRLAILASHPIQYQAPLFRTLAGSIDLTVFFCDRHGADPTFDREFGRVFRFDVPLLDGYKWQFLRNFAPRPGPTPMGLINPAVVELTSQFDAVLVHVGYTAVSSFLTLLSPKRRATILFRGESNLLPRRSPLKRIAKDLFLRPLFQRIDHFLAIGTLNREYYISYGVQPERITVAPYSVDNDYFATGSLAARSNRSAARSSLGIPTEGPLFLFAAKLIDKKRPLDAVRAFALAFDAGSAHLAIVGDGELMPAVRQVVEEAGIVPRVHILGFRNQSELPAIYGASDVLVLPSDFEPWGLVVNEAMACGVVPVVSDQVGAAPDLVEPEHVFPFGNTMALAEILRSIIRAPRDLDAARLRAARHINGWTLHRTRDAILQALDTVSSTRSERRETRA